MISRQQVPTTLQLGSGGLKTVLSNGQSVELPPHDEFYSQFTMRNRDLISEAEQRRLRTSTILVAGCGSVGGAAIEMLVRLGAERLILAEPDGYELHNINRQSVRLQDIGRNKAEVFQEKLHDINPYGSIAVEPAGITAENVERVVRSADIVLDAIDVTTQPPLEAKFLLHKAAKAHRRPVIAGYDIAGLQLLFVYDYRDSSVQVLSGRVQEHELRRLSPIDFLNRVVVSWPIPPLPVEIVPVLRDLIRGERSDFPQVVYTCHLFGVLATRAAVDLLANRPVRRRTVVDVHDILRTRPERARIFFSRLRELLALNREFRSRKRQV